MHRMRPIATPIRIRSLLLASGLTLAFGGRASADLIRPSADRAYPDIAADINGKIDYAYDSATQKGQFLLTNTPYLLAGGPAPGDEFTITPDANGIRQQVVSVALDQGGKVIADPGNSYKLYGSITAGGQQYSGLLLEGTPTAFGSKYTPPPGSQGSALFDMNISITGGALASAFGPDMYLSVQPELQVTFEGRFDKSFSAAKATSNTRAYHAPLPFPSPEPTALAILLAGGGAGLLYRGRLWQKGT